MTTPKQYQVWAVGALLLHWAVGGSVGLALGVVLVPLMPAHEGIAQTISIFVMVGMGGGLLRLFFNTYVTSRGRTIMIPREPSDAPRDAPDEIIRPPKIPPAPFDSRLARFLGCAESELRPERTRVTSKMRFWSLVPFGHWHGPKPRWRIRYLLERIRMFVRGEKSRR